MTKRERIIEALHSHYNGKEFTALDVAAHVGACRDYTQIVLQDIRGVKQVKEVETPSPRGGYCLKKAKVYTFKPVTDWRV